MTAEAVSIFSSHTQGSADGGHNDEVTLYELCEWALELVQVSRMRGGHVGTRPSRSDLNEYIRTDKVPLGIVCFVSGPLLKRRSHADIQEHSLMLKLAYTFIAARLKRAYVAQRDNTATRQHCEANMSWC